MQIIRQKVHRVTLCLLALGTLFDCAHAQDFTIYGALTSDYVYRGVSNSDEHAAVQLGLDISTDSGFFGGIWASTTDITSGDRNRAREVDYYFGYVRYFGKDWSTSLSINRYSYPGADGSVNYDYDEVATIIGFKDRFWFEIDYTDTLFGHNEPAYNLEALANWPLPELLTLSTGIGYFDISKFAGKAYSYWQVGISRPLRWMTIDLRYHDTADVPAEISRADLADSRVVLTISAAF